MNTILADLGLAAISGSAMSALVSKFSSLEEIRLTNPTLYAMLIASGTALLGELRKDEAPVTEQNLGLRIPGYMV